MKKITWIFCLILCIATFFVSPSAQADEGEIKIAPPTTGLPSFTVEDEGEIWKHGSPSVLGLPGFTVQGGVVYHSADEDPKTWTLVNGTGERKFTSHIYFRDPYQEPPTVTVSLTGMDVGKGANHRLTVKPINITRLGFDLEYKTWWDSQVYALWSSWAAFGE